MIKKIRLLLASFLVIGAALVAVQPVGAVELFKNCDSANADSVVCQQTKDGKNKTSALVQNVIKVLLWVVGVASVIMIVVGGMRYTLSGGDSSGLTGAKNTILYAVVGLVVAMLAYAIVGFVTGSFALK